MTKNTKHGSGRQKKQLNSFRAFLFRKDYLLILIFALIIVLPFFSTLKYPFHYDDIPTIFEDISTDSVQDIFNIRLSERPVRKISIILDRQLFKDNVIFYRLENIFLLALCIGLLGFLIKEITGNLLYALLAMAVFGFHPAHVENILIITHRKEIFLMIFYVLAFYAHIKQKNMLSVVFFVFALLSKEVAITFPFVILLYDRITGIKADKRYYVSMGALLVFGAAAVLIFSSKTGFFIPSVSNMNQFFKDNRMLRNADYFDIILLQPYIFAKYLYNLLLPVNLNLDYTIPVNNYLNPLYFLSVLVSTAYFAVMYFFRKQKMIFLGMAFFFINYIPVSNIVPVLNLFADRYLFLPSMALAIVLYPLYKNFKYSKYVIGSFAVILLVLSIRYIPNFKTEVGLWKYVVSKNPISVVGNNNYGLYLMKSGKQKEAEYYMKRAYELDSLYTNASINLGTLYATQKKYREAELYFKKVIELENDNVKALYNLSLVYMNTERYEDAKQVLRKIILMSPNSSLAYNNLGAAFYHDGLLSERLSRYIFAIGAFAPAMIFLTDACESFLDAEESFEKGLKVDANYKKLVENKQRIMGKINREFR